MPRTLPSALAAALLLSAACLSTEPATSTLGFDLTQSQFGDGWEIGAADYPVGREADVDMVAAGRQPVPANLGDATALYQAGTNVTGDLFLFHRKYFVGLPPNRAFKAILQVNFVTNVHAGCTTGVGPAVVIKAGVSASEPEVQPDAQNVYRFSLNKGTGVSAGDYAQLGDIRNGLAGCPASGTYAIHTSGSFKQAVDLVTDITGGFWMFLGTQSSIQARHEIYFLTVSLKLQ